MTSDIIRCGAKKSAFDYNILMRLFFFSDLLTSDHSDMFEDSSTGSFSLLLFDVARDQVIVGAR